MKLVLHVETSFSDWSQPSFYSPSPLPMNNIWTVFIGKEVASSGCLNTLMILWDINNKKLRAPWAVARLISRFMLFSIPFYLSVKSQLLCLQITGVFQLQKITTKGSHKLIFTMDVKSLYTVIPHRDGLEAFFLFWLQTTKLFFFCCIIWYSSKIKKEYIFWGGEDDYKTQDSICKLCW